MTNSVVHQLDPPRSLDDLSRDELIELLEQGHEGRITIDFKGKANARELARRVRPRIMRTVKKYSIGDENDRARNLVVEGENLQAMATLYRERGQVDLILTDPPYNTASDWRYNDRWEDDPNDSGLGDWVSEDDGARHTKWMRFMWPRLQMMKSMLKPGGVLAICIDHRELFRLGQMLDELFKETNRLAIIKLAEVDGAAQRPQPRFHSDRVRLGLRQGRREGEDTDAATLGIRKCSLPQPLPRPRGAVARTRPDRSHARREGPLRHPKSVHGEALLPARNAVVVRRYRRELRRRKRNHHPRLRQLRGLARRAAPERVRARHLPRQGGAAPAPVHRTLGVNKLIMPAPG